MRTLFLLLVLANVAFFAYVQMSPDRAGIERQLSALQIHPEKIRLIAPGGGAAGAAPAVAAAPGACLEWGVFAGPDVARADAAVATLGLPDAQVQRVVHDAGGYWVYIPPLRNKAEVEKRLAELKTLDIPDSFVVQDAGPWRNAISLGIFKTEEAANGYLETLRARGLASAVAERREKFLKQIVFLVREPSQDTVAKLTELQRGFSGTRIRAAACPPEDAASR